MEDPGLRVIVLWTHVIATTVMLLAIWYVQLYRYPSFAQIPTDQFVDIHRAYSNRITFIVAPAMILEAISAIYLWRFFQHQPQVQIWLTVGLVIIAVNWLSTAFLQVPQHSILAEGFNAAAQKRLVDSNWLRTFCWTVRGAIVIYLWPALRSNISL